MKTYLVGGALRDELLGLPIKDKDYVVVGSSPKQMLALGFKQVGRDFPVFLHPQTKEEYALARTERKVGVGHHGFNVNSDETVTLVDDLERRDLTINAMARSETGRIIDPYGGLTDLDEKVLRHVSCAFVEDPLRVLRVARFFARFAHLGFTIADETLVLMREISASGELNSLSSERVWQEVAGALSETEPTVFFECLREVGALKELMPEVERLFGVPQTKKWHPEVDTGVHTLMVLKASSAISEDQAVRFGALTHDLGKGITPMSQWPSHKGHDVKGVALVEELCARLRVPKAMEAVARLACQHHTQIHKAKELSAKALLKLLEHLDPFRQYERFLQILMVCMSDARGRLGYEKTDYPQKEYLEKAFKSVGTLDLKSIVAEAKQSHKDIGDAVYRARLNALKAYLKEGD